MDYRVISGVEHYLNCVQAVRKNQNARLIDEKRFINIKNATFKKGTEHEKDTKGQ